MCRSMFRFARALSLVLALVPPIAAAQAGATFSQAQIDQMLAPIALYPDQLLSQVLMASTYPAEVAEAARWSTANPNQRGDAAVTAVQNQAWDPSVQSLVAFPPVIQMMGAQPDWVQNLGDAFLASSSQMLDSAQRLRSQAIKAGSLKTSEQQNVVVEQDAPSQQTIIRIEPTNPQVVYVPAYNPTVVYGSWAYPNYPPVYYPPPRAYYPGQALAAGIMFGVGVGIVHSLWSDCDWRRRDVNINVNRYNNININRRIDVSQTTFRHNPIARRGVPYRDERTRQAYRPPTGGAAQRAEFRGREPAPRPAQPAAQPGVARDRPSPPAAQRPRDRSNDAFAGARDPDRSRQQAQRGSASRQSMAQNARPAPKRAPPKGNNDRTR